MVEGHLLNWKRWMQTRSGVVGLPSRSLGFAQSCSHFEDLTDAADLYAARATDALIQDLPPAPKAAVEHKYLHTVWRYHMENLDTMLEQAFNELAQGMSRRGLL